MTPEADPRVLLTGGSLTLSEVVAVASGASADASPQALDSVRAGHDRALSVAARREVYGLSTGVGAARDQLTAGDEEQGLRLLRSHAAGWGELLPAGVVRAALVVRANQLLCGRSSARPEVVAALLGLLAGADADLPVVHTEGSLGTGDLTQLAEVGLALVGERPRAGGAVRRALAVGAADALPLLSSNAFTVARAALAMAAVSTLADTAVDVAALGLVAAQGNPEAVSETAAAATPFGGAHRVMAQTRWLVAGEDWHPAHIQDAFGQRTWPQVHGALLDSLDRLREVVEALANTGSENPAFTDAATGAVVAHHGGFHTAYLALALDTTLLALAGSASAVESRVSHLVTDTSLGLPLFLADGTPGASGVLIAEYVAASAAAVLREVAASPSSLLTTSVSAGVEDDAGFAGRGAARLERAVTAYRRLLAVELVCTVRALRLRGVAPGGALGDLLTACGGISADLADRPMDEDLDTAEAVLAARGRRAG